MHMLLGLVLAFKKQARKQVVKLKFSNDRPQSRTYPYIYRLFSAIYNNIKIGFGD